jgi:ferritin-like metal-binding protein YciE
LIDALESHLEETKNQVTKLEEVFESIDKKASAKKCDAMAGLIEEAEGIMEECEEGAMCDAGIISAGQKVEHYEIASYGTLRQFARTLNLGKAAKMLEEILNEEKAPSLPLILKQPK